MARGRSPRPTRKTPTSAPTRRATQSSPPGSQHTIETVSRSTHLSKYFRKRSISVPANYRILGGCWDHRPSSFWHLEKPTESKSPYHQLTLRVPSKVAPAPPVAKSTDPGVRKSSKSKDRDKDRDIRGRERDRPPAVGRHTDKRLDYSGPLPESFRYYRRHLTEDDVVTLKVNSFSSPLSST